MAENKTPEIPEDPVAQRLMLEELLGLQQRSWPNGRIDAEDDGQATLAITTDPVRKVVRIQFAKPMNWIGLDLATARMLRDHLSSHILELESLSSP